MTITVPRLGMIDLPEASYLGDPCVAPSLSSHTAQLLIAKSPAHAYADHPRLGAAKRKPKKEFDMGSVVHKLILGVGRDVVTIDAPNWKKKEHQKARADLRAEGKLAVLPHELEACTKAAGAVFAKLDKAGYALYGASEVSTFWEETTDDGEQVQCRARLDHFIEDSAEIWDVKTSRSAHPRACEGHVESYGYGIQAAAYTRAAEANFPELAGRIRYRWIFVELDPPYVVTIAEPDGTCRAIGAERWRRGVNIWAKCLNENVWPEYSEDVVQISAPHWAVSETMTSGMPGWAEDAMEEAS